MLRLPLPPPNEKPSVFKYNGEIILIMIVKPTATEALRALHYQNN